MSAKPACCPICGQYLTTHIYFYGCRCLEPSHWQAAGLLNKDDYYAMGQLIVQQMLEPHHFVSTTGEHCDTTPLTQA
jgi:hypothetical protein